MDLSEVLIEGISVKVVTQVKENLICILCSKMLENPHQATCGCRFCFNCINEYLRKKKTFCPGKTEYCLDKMLNIGTDVRPDALATREMNKLVVKCPFISCKEASTLREMKDHLVRCGSLSVVCSQCNQNVVRREYGNHASNECLEGLVRCNCCCATMKKRLFKEEHHNYVHRNICTSYADYCPNDCGESDVVLWAEHRKVCGVKYVSCPYKVVGCSSTITTLRNMAKHMADCGYDHAEGVSKHIENTNNEMSCFNKSLAGVKRDIGSLRVQFSSIECYNKRQSLNNTAYSGDIARIKAQMKDMEIQSQIKDREIMSNKQEILGLKNIVSSLQKKHRTRDVVFMGVVDNFSQAHDLYWPDFYTDTMGYKMRLELRKRVKGYLSLFIALRIGEYDDDLSWPFRSNIAVQIMDQEFLGRDFERVISFNSISKEDYYESDVGDHGFGSFISYQELKEKPNLLKNNKLIIQCIVDELATPYGAW